MIDRPGPALEREQEKGHVEGKMVAAEGVAARVCARPALAARGWRPIANDCLPDEMEYSKEFPAPDGRTYHVFARDKDGVLALHVAYVLHAGTRQVISAALRPDQLPEEIRRAAQADLSAVE